MGNELIADGKVVEAWVIYCSTELIKTRRNRIAGSGYHGWNGRKSIYWALIAV